MTTYVEAIQKSLVLPLEKLTNKVFTQKYNPFYYHGALPNLFLWALFVSGLLLLVYYQPTLGTAYNTMKFITYQAPFGNAIRSIHRYAADGMMIFVILHLLRVWFTDRYREYRIIPWLSGVILFTVLFIVGLTGYMLIWDQDAVALTNVTLNLLRALPVVGQGWANFLIASDTSASAVMTDYTITRLLVLHLGIPMLMMFLLWWHYLRITRPVTDAPLALVLLMLGALLVFSGAMPVVLGDMAPPSFDIAAQSIHLDALYAWPQQLALSGWPVSVVWLLVLAVPVGLLVLPYLQKKAMRGQYAQVAKENCTGCSLCYNDCPYQAITMVDRNDGSRFKRLATVDPARCANCGLCVGACAFKAIDIPRCESKDVLAEIEAALAS
ncbi:MAG: cytochrome b N-terminal domain-containing protein [Vampirovibrionales bacterium]